VSGGLRLYAIPYSTNVERVGLVLGHKGLTAEIVMCDPADRSPIREASGQDLVPVLDDDGFAVLLSDGPDAARAVAEIATDE